MTECHSQASQRDFYDCLCGAAEMSGASGRRRVQSATKWPKAARAICGTGGITGFRSIYRI
jgi:hypothetical protein